MPKMPKPQQPSQLASWLGITNDEAYQLRQAAGVGSLSSLVEVAGNYPSALASRIANAGVFGNEQANMLAQRLGQMPLDNYFAGKSQDDYLFEVEAMQQRNSGFTAEHPMISQFDDMISSRTAQFNQKDLFFPMTESQYRQQVNEHLHGVMPMVGQQDIFSGPDIQSSVGKVQNPLGAQRQDSFRDFFGSIAGRVNQRSDMSMQWNPETDIGLGTPQGAFSIRKDRESYYLWQDAQTGGIAFINQNNLSGGHFVSNVIQETGSGQQFINKFQVAADIITAGPTQENPDNAFWKQIQGVLGQDGNMDGGAGANYTPFTAYTPIEATRLSSMVSFRLNEGMQGNRRNRVWDMLENVNEQIRGGWNYDATTGTQMNEFYMRRGGADQPHGYGLENTWGAAGYASRQRRRVGEGGGLEFAFQNQSGEMAWLSAGSTPHPGFRSVDEYFIAKPGKRLQQNAISGTVAERAAGPGVLFPKQTMPAMFTGEYGEDGLATTFGESAPLEGYVQRNLYLLDKLSIPEGQRFGKAFHVTKSFTKTIEAGEGDHLRSGDIFLDQDYNPGVFSAEQEQRILGQTGDFRGLSARFGNATGGMVTIEGIKELKGGRREVEFRTYTDKTAQKDKDKAQYVNVSDDWLQRFGSGTADAVSAFPGKDQISNVAWKALRTELGSSDAVSSWFMNYAMDAMNQPDNLAAQAFAAQIGYDPSEPYADQMAMGEIDTMTRDGRFAPETREIALQGATNWFMSQAQVVEERGGLFSRSDLEKQMLGWIGEADTQQYDQLMSRLATVQTDRNATDEQRNAVFGDIYRTFMSTANRGTLHRYDPAGNLSGTENFYRFTNLQGLDAEGNKVKDVTQATTFRAGVTRHIGVEVNNLEIDRWEGARNTSKIGAETISWMEQSNPALFGALQDMARSGRFNSSAVKATQAYRANIAPDQRDKMNIRDFSPELYQQAHNQVTDELAAEGRSLAGDRLTQSVLRRYGRLSGGDAIRMQTSGGDNVILPDAGTISGMMTIGRGENTIPGPGRELAAALGAMQINGPSDSTDAQLRIAVGALKEHVESASVREKAIGLEYPRIGGKAQGSTAVPEGMAVLGLDHLKEVTGIRNEDKLRGMLTGDDAEGRQLIGSAIRHPEATPHSSWVPHEIGVYEWMQRGNDLERQIASQVAKPGRNFFMNATTMEAMLGDFDGDEVRMLMNYVEHDGQIYGQNVPTMNQSAFRNHISKLARHLPFSESVKQIEEATERGSLQSYAGIVSDLFAGAKAWFTPREAIEQSYIPEERVGAGQIGQMFNQFGRNMRQVGIETANNIANQREMAPEARNALREAMNVGTSQMFGYFYQMPLDREAIGDKSALALSDTLQGLIMNYDKGTGTQVFQRSVRDENGELVVQNGKPLRRAVGNVSSLGQDVIDNMIMLDKGKDFVGERPVQSDYISSESYQTAMRSYEQRNIVAERDYRETTARGAIASMIPVDVMAQHAEAGTLGQLEEDIYQQAFRPARDRGYVTSTERDAFLGLVDRKNTAQWATGLPGQPESMSTIMLSALGKAEVGMQDNLGVTSGSSASMAAGGAVRGVNESNAALKAKGSSQQNLNALRGGLSEMMGEVYGGTRMALDEFDTKEAEMLQRLTPASMAMSQGSDGLELPDGTRVYPGMFEQGMLAQDYMRDGYSRPSSWGKGDTPEEQAALMLLNTSVLPEQRTGAMESLIRQGVINPDSSAIKWDETAGTALQNIAQDPKAPTGLRERAMGQIQRRSGGSKFAEMASHIGDLVEGKMDKSMSAAGQIVASQGEISLAEYGIRSGRFDFIMNTSEGQLLTDMKVKTARNLKSEVFSGVLDGQKLRQLGLYHKAASNEYEELNQDFVGIAVMSSEPFKDGNQYYSAPQLANFALQDVEGGGTRLDQMINESLVAGYQMTEEFMSGPRPDGYTDAEWSRLSAAQGRELEAARAENRPVNRLELASKAHNAVDQAHGVFRRIRDQVQRVSRSGAGRFQLNENLSGSHVGERIANFVQQRVSGGNADAVLDLPSVRPVGTPAANAADTLPPGASLAGEAHESARPGTAQNDAIIAQAERHVQEHGNYPRWYARWRKTGDASVVPAASTQPTSPIKQMSSPPPPPPPPAGSGGLPPSNAGSGGAAPPPDDPPPAAGPIPPSNQGGFSDELGNRMANSLDQMAEVMSAGGFNRTTNNIYTPYQIAKPALTDEQYSAKRSIEYLSAAHQYHERHGDWGNFSPKKIIGDIKKVQNLRRTMGRRQDLIGSKELTNDYLDDQYAAFFERGEGVENFEHFQAQILAQRGDPSQIRPHIDALIGDFAMPEVYDQLMRMREDEARTGGARRFGRGMKLSQLRQSQLQIGGLTGQGGLAIAPEGAEETLRGFTSSIRDFIETGKEATEVTASTVGALKDFVSTYDKLHDTFGKLEEKIAKYEKDYTGESLDGFATARDKAFAQLSTGEQELYRTFTETMFTDRDGRKGTLADWMQASGGEYADVVDILTQLETGEKRQEIPLRESMMGAYYAGTAALNTVRMTVGQGYGMMYTDPEFDRNVAVGAGLGGQSTIYNRMLMRDQIRRESQLAAESAFGQFDDFAMLANEAGIGETAMRFWQNSKIATSLLVGGAMGGEALKMTGVAGLQRAASGMQAMGAKLGFGYMGATVAAEGLNMAFDNDMSAIDWARYGIGQAADSVLWGLGELGIGGRRLSDLSTGTELDRLLHSFVTPTESQDDHMDQLKRTVAARADVLGITSDEYAAGYAGLRHYLPSSQFGDLTNDRTYTLGEGWSETAPEVMMRGFSGVSRYTGVGVQQLVQTTGQLGQTMAGGYISESGMQEAYDLYINGGHTTEFEMTQAQSWVQRNAQNFAQLALVTGGDVASANSILSAYTGGPTLADPMQQYLGQGMFNLAYADYHMTGREMQRMPDGMSYTMLKDVAQSNAARESLIGAYQSQSILGVGSHQFTTAIVPLGSIDSLQASNIAGLSAQAAQMGITLDTDMYSLAARSDQFQQGNLLNIQGVLGQRGIDPNIPGSALQSYGTLSAEQQGAATALFSRLSDNATTPEQVRAQLDGISDIIGGSTGEELSRRLSVSNTLRDLGETDLDLLRRNTDAVSDMSNAQVQRFSNTQQQLEALGLRAAEWTPIASMMATDAGAAGRFGGLVSQAMGMDMSGMPNVAQMATLATQGVDATNAYSQFTGMAYQFGLGGNLSAEMGWQMTQMGLTNPLDVQRAGQMTGSLFGMGVSGSQSMMLGAMNALPGMSQYDYTAMTRALGGDQMSLAMIQRGMVDGGLLGNTLAQTAPQALIDPTTGLSIYRPQKIALEAEGHALQLGNQMFGLEMSQQQHAVSNAFQFGGQYIDPRTGQVQTVQRGTIDLQWAEFAKQGRQQEWQFDFERRQMDIGYERQETGQRIQGEQLQQRYQWQMGDFARGESMAQMQFGWQLEDFDENLKFAKGRDRFRMLRQRDRAVISESVRREGADQRLEQIEREQEWAEEQYELNKNYFEEDKEMQEERFQKSKDFYHEDRRFQEERMRLSEEQARISTEFQEQQLQQQEYMIHQNERMYQKELQLRYAMEEHQGAMQVYMQQTLPQLLEQLDSEDVRNYFDMMGTGMDGLIQQAQEFLALADLASGGTKNAADSAKDAANNAMGAVNDFINRFTGFDDGGYTGDGPRGEIAGVVHRGEYVVPQGGALVIKGEESGVNVLREILRVLMDIRDRRNPQLILQNNAQVGMNGENLFESMFGGL